MFYAASARRPCAVIDTLQKLLGAANRRQSAAKGRSLYLLYQPDNGFDSLAIAAD